MRAMMKAESNLAVTAIVGSKHKQESPIQLLCKLKNQRKKSYA